MKSARKANTSATIPKKTPKLKKNKTVLKTASSEKKVQFDCKPTDKESIKYVTTPFSSSVKKAKGSVSETKKVIKNQKKLSFDEENEPPAKPNATAKKRKNEAVELEKSKISESLSSQPKKKKKKKVDGNNSDETNVSVELMSDDVSGSNFQRKKRKLDKSNANDSIEDQDKKERTVYIGNIPLTYDHKKVMKIFKEFGAIESARIRGVPVPDLKVKKKTAAITKNFHPDRKSCDAYVVFKSKDDVAKVVEKNGMVLDGHHLRIDYAFNKNKDLKKSVFVGCLAFDLEDDELWDFFKDCGEIESVRIIRDNNIKMGKGFGYVNFKSLSSVELALKLNGQELKNRAINVQRCVKKVKKKLSKSQRSKKFRRGRGPRKGVLSEPKSSASTDFQGRKAEQKLKKKKTKPTKDAQRKKKIMSTLQPSLKKKKA